MLVTYWAMFPKWATTQTRPSVVGSVASAKATGTTTAPSVPNMNSSTASAGGTPRRGLGRPQGRLGGGRPHHQRERAVAALVEARAQDVQPPFGVRPRHAEAIGEQPSDVRGRPAAEHQEHQPGGEHGAAMC